MKVEQLRILLKEYDQSKNWWQRLRGEAPQIKALKNYLYVPENADFQIEDCEVSLKEFQEYLSAQEDKIDLSDAYLNSNEVSAKLFKCWRDHDIDQGINEATKKFLANLQQQFDTELQEHLSAMEDKLKKIKIAPSNFVPEVAATCNVNSTTNPTQQPLYFSNPTQVLLFPSHTSSLLCAGLTLAPASIGIEEPASQQSFQPGK